MRRREIWTEREPQKYRAMEMEKGDGGKEGHEKREEMEKRDGDEEKKIKRGVEIEKNKDMRRSEDGEKGMET